MSSLAAGAAGCGGTVSAPGGGGDVGAALERMGTDLFAMVEGDSESTQEAAHFVATFSRLAAAWQAAGQPERARWCLERAMRYSHQVRPALGPRMGEGQTGADARAAACQHPQAQRPTSASAPTRPLPCRAA